tara:strand:+ start:1929 stop:2408 length:480 start_codon:yes stop_codon:yes gene_type:complete
MKLKDKINNNNIIYPIESNDKATTIQELLNKLLDQQFLTATTKLFTFIKDHDKIMNPAVGRGIAFHHSSSIEVDDMVAVLGISNKGLDYGSPDQQKVHFILLILDPVNEPTLHRKFIHRFQKFINDCNIKTKLLECSSSEQIVNLIYDWEEKYLLSEEI